MRRCGEIGRRKGLKIPRWKHRTGSIPVSGTSKKDAERRLFCWCRGERIPCTDLKAPALIEREGRTRRWSSLHTSLPLRGDRLVRFGPLASFLLVRKMAGSAYLFIKR